jgi:hypothetical protein
VLGEGNNSGFSNASEIDRNAVIKFNVKTRLANEKLPGKDRKRMEKEVQFLDPVKMKINEESCNGSRFIIAENTALPENWKNRMCRDAPAAPLS